MSEIDPITGLPKELGAWETITKEGQTINAIEKKLGVSIDVQPLGKKQVAKAGSDIEFGVKMSKKSVVFEVGEDTNVRESNNVPQLLETATSTHDMTEVPSSVSVAGEILTEFGDPKLCLESLVKRPCSQVA